jgi:hypothetical protein
VTETALRNYIIGSDQIENGSVTVPKLATNSVITSKIVDEAVTSVKLASGSVTESKISNSAVTTAKINDNAVTDTKVSTGAIVASKLSGVQGFNDYPIYGIRAFGRIDDNGVISRASGNIQSANWFEEGKCRITFTTPVPMNNYTVIVTDCQDFDHILSVTEVSTASFVVTSFDTVLHNMLLANKAFSGSNSQPRFQNNRFNFVVVF